MARTGRPSLPIEELKRRGTYRKDRHAKRERDSVALAIPPGLPTPPAKLTPAARAQWDRLIALLGPANILRPTDGEGLAILCDSLAMREALCIERDKQKPVGNSDWRRHEDQIDQVTKRIHTYQVHFGLLPDTRHRIKPGKDDAPPAAIDPKKKLFQQGLGSSPPPVLGKIGGASA